MTKIEKYKCNLCELHLTESSGNALLSFCSPGTDQSYRLSDELELSEKHLCCDCVSRLRKMFERGAGALKQEAETLFPDPNQIDAPGSGLLFAPKYPDLPVLGERTLRKILHNGYAMVNGDELAVAILRTQIVNLSNKLIPANSPIRRIQARDCF